jgi:hypothetical protein
MYPPSDAFFCLLLTKFEQASHCHGIQTELVLRACYGSPRALLSTVRPNTIAYGLCVFKL